MAEIEVKVLVGKEDEDKARDKVVELFRDVMGGEFGSIGNKIIETRVLGVEQVEGEDVLQGKKGNDVTVELVVGGATEEQAEEYLLNELDKIFDKYYITDVINVEVQK